MDRIVRRLDLVENGKHTGSEMTLFRYFTIVRRENVFLFAMANLKLTDSVTHSFALRHARFVVVLH